MQHIEEILEGKHHEVIGPILPHYHVGTLWWLPVLRSGLPSLDLDSGDVENPVVVSYHKSVRGFHLSQALAVGGVRAFGFEALRYRNVDALSFMSLSFSL